MVCIHFVPWMISSSEECARLSILFETDMHGKEFDELSITIGGDKANEYIASVVNHASRMGYMNIFE